jgi:hypothetical protein
MKITLILACFAVVVRSGPLPACLWDEVIESWTSNLEGPESSDPVVASAVDSKSVSPLGDDSPDQILYDQIVQQSLGQLNGSSTSDPNHGAAGLGIVPRCDLCLMMLCAPVQSPRLPSLAASPPVVQFHPLLI